MNACWSRLVFRCARRTTTAIHVEALNKAMQTCGDIHTHRAVLCLMDKTFGLRHMLRIHLGIASNVVQPGQREERKSIGAER